MNLINTPILGLLVAESKSAQDHRGSFSRFFCEAALHESLHSKHITQINHSHTTALGSVRGLHFQHPPHAEIKFVRCLKGRVWDVVVDLRKGSRTFLKWFSQELSPENSLMMIIPEGCGHGFQSLEPNCEMLYLHTASYSPEHESGLRPNDPMLNISWPLPITTLTDRDRNHPLINGGFRGIEL